MFPAWILWSPTKASHSIFHAFKFRAPSVEQAFQKDCNRLRVLMAIAYFTFSSLLNTIHAVSFLGTEEDLPLAFWCFVIAAAIPAVALVVLLTIRPARREVVLLHAGITLVSLLFPLYTSSAIVDDWLLSITLGLERKFPTSMVDDVSGILSVVCANQGRMMMSLACHFHLISLSFMGYNHSTVPVWLSFVTIFFVVTSVGPHGVTTNVAYFSAEMLLSIFPFVVLCVCIEVLQRSYFYSQQELKRELEISQMAESMLNNVVKSAMSDAVANVQEFLNSGIHATESVLCEALAGLSRGIRSCRQRQAFLALVSDVYEPRFVQVSLRDFGEALVAGRAVVGSFSEGHVLLDPLLCNLVLENAIAQAFLHGHPQGPDVRVRIFPEIPFGEASVAVRSTVQVVFEVSFAGVDENLDVCINGDSIQPRTRGSIPAHCMTQRHLKMAADAHGMMVKWLRAEERIVFRAIFRAQVGADQQHLPEMPPRSLLDAFPPGLIFYIIDDSIAARRLLASCITQMAAPGAVHCYGTYPEDVHQFVAASSQDADIVICDQHLDYGDQHYLGSDLIRSLRDRGFQGLLCMRSSDVNEHDRELYCAAGAHCTFGKEELSRDVVESIKVAYVELKGLHIAHDTVSSLALLNSDTNLASSLQSSHGGWGSNDHSPFNCNEERRRLHFSDMETLSP